MCSNDEYHIFYKQYAYFDIMFICAGNTFLTSKVHSFRKMELTVSIEWKSNSSLVQIFEVMSWPYITKS